MSWLILYFQHIKELGSWTITSGALSGTFDKSSWNIQTAIVKSHLLKHSPFFSMSVGTDEKNSSAYIIGVSHWSMYTLGIKF